MPSLHAQDRSALSDSVLVERVFLIGNEKTKSPIILREIEIEEGKKYPDSLLNILAEEGRMRIYNTNLFNTVTVQVLKDSPNTANVLITLEERWYFYVAPIFRIDDRNLMDWLINRGGDLGRTNYGLKMDQYNFRGNNEKLRFIGQAGFQKRYFLSYSIPYIEKSQRHGLIFEGAFLERESLPYITEDHLPSFNMGEDINRQVMAGLVTYSYRPNFYDFHFVTGGYRKVNVTDTIVSLNPNYLGNGATSQQFFNLIYTYVHDFRNNRNYPTKGDFTRIMLDQKGLGKFDDINITSLTTHHSRYFELSPKNSFAAGMIGYFSTPRNQGYYNYGAIGFEEIFMRGFELDVIEAPKFIIIKSDLRHKFFDRKFDMGKMMPIKQFNNMKLAMHAKVFGDIGWAQSYPNYEISSRLNDKLLYAVGTGVDLVLIYDLVLRVEYSYTSKNTFNFAVNVKAGI